MSDVIHHCDITTKAGDKGESSLYNGKRLPKDDIHFEVLGSLDECNSFIGLSREFLSDSCLDVDQYLEFVQCILFDVCSAVATPLLSSKQRILDRTVFDSANVHNLEKWSDDLDVQLPFQDSFLLPSGGKAASHLHVARSVCRRAERSMSVLLRSGDISTDVYEYINRLSDFLYIAARYISMKENNPPKVWKKVLNK